MDITIENVQPNHLKVFEEIAKALGLNVKKSEQGSNERKAIIEAIERVESGNEENISIDIETLKKMVYANP